MPPVKPGRYRASITQNYPSGYKGREKPSAPFFFIRLGLLLAVLVGLIGGGFWLFQSGWVDRQLDAAYDFAIDVTQKAGFSIKNVVVEGRLHTDKEELIAALGARVGAPVLAFDPELALSKIQKLTWVSKAVVVRRLPDTVFVSLTERIPSARWQHSGKVVIIDRDGQELPNVRPEKFSSLPLVVGEDAPSEAAAMLDELRDYPLIMDVLVSAVRVSDRRWNLILSPKVIVRLPQQNIGNALQKLTQLVRNQKILERGVVAVDLRLPDRLFLETGIPQKTDVKP